MTMMRKTALCAATVAATWLVFAESAEARPHHRRLAPARFSASVAPPAKAEARAPFSFYPFEIEGGVSGNLPFNNQIRKMTDPLNADGAGS